MLACYELAMTWFCTVTSVTVGYFAVCVAMPPSMSGVFDLCLVSAALHVHGVSSVLSGVRERVTTEI